MSVPIPPGLGVNVGQPTRADFHGEAHLRALQPGQQLDIPRQGIPSPRNQPHTDAERRGDGWRRQDAAHDASFEQARAGQGWARFAGHGRREGWGPTKGAVQFDQPTFRVQDLAVSGNPRDWATSAAELEERFRADGERYGISAELRLPSELAAARREGGAATSGRRSFTLKAG